MPRALASWLLAAAFAAAPAVAADLAGTRTVALEEADGSKRVIGSVELSADGEGWRFEVSLDDGQFEDHFLSMRPFKCLPHARYLLCHLPYPYENARRISADDLVDLEYDLLFIQKAPSEYGINPYNGLYYQLAFDGGRIRGTLRETDLDVLAAPPEDGNLRPIGAEALYEAELDLHAYPALVVE